MIVVSIEPVKNRNPLGDSVKHSRRHLVGIMTKLVIALEQTCLWSHCEMPDIGWQMNQQSSAEWLLDDTDPPPAKLSYKPKE